MRSLSETVFQTIVQLNPHIQIHHVSDASFIPYGRIIEGYEFDQLDVLMKDTPIPKNGNVYIASHKALENTPVFDLVSSNLFGGQPIQIGYCNGVNSFLNGLEYHKSSEVNIAMTNLVLLLGRVQEIVNNRYDIRNIEGFFIPKGTAIEVYGTTLHYGPCKVNNLGFKCVVILPKGTNAPLESNIHKVTKEDELLFMQNKWLLVHPDRVDSIRNGAIPGIRGENIELLYK